MRLEQQAGIGLAIGMVGVAERRVDRVRVEGADVEGVDPRALDGEVRLHLRVQLLHGLQVVKPRATPDWLVATMASAPGLVQPAYSPASACHPFEAATHRLHSQDRR